MRTERTASRGPSPTAAGEGSESLAGTVLFVNDRPVRTSPSALAAVKVGVNKRQRRRHLLGLGELAYQLGGGAEEADRTLTFRWTGVPTFVAVFEEDGTTPVRADMLRVPEGPEAESRAKRVNGKSCIPTPSAGSLVA